MKTKLLLILTLFFTTFAFAQIGFQDHTVISDNNSLDNVKSIIFIINSSIPSLEQAEGSSSFSTSCQE